MSAETIIFVVLCCILAYALIRLVVEILTFIFLVFNDVSENTFDERDRQSLHDDHKDL